MVYGVAVPGADGKAGMAAVTLRDGHELDGARLAAHLFDRLPSYAVPLFVRVVDSLETTSTFKSRKVELREEAYSSDVERLYVLRGRRDGSGPRTTGNVREVADGTAPGA